MEQVKYQIPGATGISLQLQMITLLGDAAAAGFTINLFNAQPIMSWPEPGCMALAMVLMKNTLMRIAVLSANCQSGAWASSTNYNGSYSSLGAFISTYTSVNGTGRPMTVYASGGVSTVDRKIKDGDDCRNTWDLTGIVDGRIITSAGTANSDWSKSGSINFIIPAGATFSITSSPLPSYGCSPGSFSLVTYY
ncbi:TPA: hypothetical protein R4Y24_005866 [Citrobacter freundii]|nr:hypothetical protein [Salmonella enterica subsp. enterica serovar Infantis]HED2403648.1 hypothetical protein [Citrobacter freundii]